jgi:hypothetical protein
VPVQTLIKLRRGTAAEWTDANPVLASGEPGFETDTEKLKIGNGSDDWATLPYIVGGSGSAVWGAITGDINDQTDLQAEFATKVDANAPITGATHTKVTYDTKGLITAGTQAALASSDFANQGTTTTVLHGNAAGNPAFNPIVEADLSLSDNTTANVSSTKHGFAPKAPADAAKFLNGDTTPAFAQVKDSDLSTSDVTTNNVSSTKHGFAPKSPADAAQFLNGAATPAFAAVKDSDLSTSDITTNNVSTSKHGFTPKLPNDATKYLDGTGAYTVPAGSSSNILAYVGYAQGTDTTLHAASTNTMTAMDATNVKVTFTAPASGNVLVECSVLHDLNTAGNTFWGLLDGGGSTVAQVFAINQGTGGAFADYRTAKFVVTGLTPGNSYTYKFAHRCTSGTTNAYSGPTYGQAIMVVFSL